MFKNSKKILFMIHGISGAIALGSMLFFAFTGMTLNHGEALSAQPAITEEKLSLPEEFHSALKPETLTGSTKRAFFRWIEQNSHYKSAGYTEEWSEFEYYAKVQKPGYTSWLSIDLETYETLIETTDRGTISTLNDLHRGLYTGNVWKGYLDAFSIASIVFSLTGLMILYVHLRRKKHYLWWLLLGLLMPVALAVFAVHL